MLAWMGYVFLVSTLAALAAALLEGLMRATRRPVRWLWLAALVAGPALSMMPPDRIDSGTVAFTAGRRSDVRAMGRGTAANGAFRDRRAMPDAASTPLPGTLPLDGLLMSAWALAAAACVIRLAIRSARLARVRRATEPTTLDGWPVLVSPDVGPAAMGVIRSRVVLPRWCLALDADTQALIIAHERSHVESRDPLLLWTASLLVALIPWNPALWLALRRLRAAIEIDCDRRTLRARRSDVRRYCELLLQVGEHTLAEAAPALALAEPAGLLERRIDAMTTNTRLLSGRVLLPSLAGVLMMTAACWSPRPELGLRDLAFAAMRPSMSSSAMAPAPGTATNDTVSSRTRDSASAMAKAERVHLAGDSLLRRQYPGLLSRADRTDAVVAMVLDDDGHIVRHASRTGAEYVGQVDDVLRRIGIDTITSRTTELYLWSRADVRVHMVAVTESHGPLIPGVRGVSGWFAPFDQPGPGAAP